MEQGGENLYNFVFNDPLVLIDILGLNPMGPVIVPAHQGTNCAGTAIFPNHVGAGGQAQYVPSPDNMITPSGENNEDGTPGAGCREVSGASDCKTEKPDCERHVIIYIPLIDSWDSGGGAPNYHAIGQNNCGGSYIHQTGSNGDIRGPVPDPSAAARAYYDTLEDPRPLIETHYCCPNDQ